MGSEHVVELAVHKGKEQCDERIIQYITHTYMYMIIDIVRSFNSKAKGFSVKTGKPKSVNAHFNRAVSGAVSE